MQIFKYVIYTIVAISWDGMVCIQFKVMLSLHMYVYDDELYICVSRINYYVLFCSVCSSLLFQLRWSPVAHSVERLRCKEYNIYIFHRHLMYKWLQFSSLIDCSRLWCTYCCSYILNRLLNIYVKQAVRL